MAPQPADLPTGAVTARRTHLSSLDEPFLPSLSRGEGRSVPCRHRVHGLETDARPRGHLVDESAERPEPGRLPDDLRVHCEREDGVVDRADESVPVTETLARLVRAWERDRGLR